MALFLSAGISHLLDAPLVMLVPRAMWAALIVVRVIVSPYLFFHPLLLFVLLTIGSQA